MWNVIVLAALTLAAALQLGILYGLGRRRPVGDEVEYLARSSSRDPFASTPFLRPPGMIVVALLLGSEGRIRCGLALTGFLTVATVAPAAWLVGGGATALAAILFLLLPERLIYACHIWPDTLLAAVMAAVVLVLSLAQPNHLLPLSLLATLAMIGTLIRIDFLPVAPFSGAALAAAGAPLPGRGWLLLLTPTALAVLLWTWRNWRRHRHPVFEDTWAFNMMVAGECIAAPERGHSYIAPVIKRVFPRWKELNGPQRTLKALGALASTLTRPLEALRQIGRRAITYLGPDTFIPRTLLKPCAAYPDLSLAAVRRFKPFLRHSFPLLVTLCLLGLLLLGERLPPYAWPAAGVALGGILVHTRTRYRVVVMPALALLAADLSLRSAERLAGESAGVTISVLGIGLGLLFILSRTES